MPVSFTACDPAGNPIGTKKFVKEVVLVTTTSLPTSAGLNELWYVPVGGFTYSSSTGLWQGYINTAKLSAGKKYTYRVMLSDGTSFTVTFGVR